ncbi:MAG: RNA polymerase subunit sigma-24 [Verrucomicrobia bacterium]|nr:MAG: RNA polymerase subunit sigma-24 [Verrucomicrobiota bacterium]
MMPLEDPPNASRKDWFVTTTHWGLVLSAAGAASPAADAALNELCRMYWYPLYAYVRRRGYSPEDAQDLTQGFFERLLARNFLENLTPQKGKFRCFLLAAMNHFLADEWDKARAVKRGGGKRPISVEEVGLEDRFLREPADGQSPEKLFDRRWALSVLDEAQKRLEAEYTRLRKSDQYQRLKIYAGGDEDAPTYAAAAAELKMSEASVRAAVFQLRRRYRQLAREVVAQTVPTASEIDRELESLIEALRA